MFLQIEIDEPLCPLPRWQGLVVPLLVNEILLDERGVRTGLAAAQHQRHPNDQVNTWEKQERQRRRTQTICLTVIAFHILILPVHVVRMTRNYEVYILFVQ